MWSCTHIQLKQKWLLYKNEIRPRGDPWKCLYAPYQVLVIHSAFQRLFALVGPSGQNPDAIVQGRFKSGKVEGHMLELTLLVSAGLYETCGRELFDRKSNGHPLPPTSMYWPWGLAIIMTSLSLLRIVTNDVKFCVQHRRSPWGLRRPTRYSYCSLRLIWRWQMICFSFVRLEDALYVNLEEGLKLTYAT